MVVRSDMLNRNNHASWTALALAVCATVPARAFANTCTIAPAVTISLGTRPSAPTVPGTIAASVPFDVAWHVGAQHDAECSNMTEGGNVEFAFAAMPMDPISPTNLTENHTDDMGTGTYTIPGGHLIATLSASCACGILGGPLQNVTSSDIIVPVTIETGFVGYYLESDPSMSQSLDAQAAEMTVPVGGPIRVLGAAWHAELTTGESATEVVDYGAGVRDTNVIAYDGNEHLASGAFAIPVRRDHVGDVTLYVEFQGTRSNVLTLHVTAGGADAGTDAATSAVDAGAGDSGTTGGTSHGGCSVSRLRTSGRENAGATVGVLSALALIGARSRRRRRAG